MAGRLSEAGARARSGKGKPKRARPRKQAEPNGGTAEKSAPPQSNVPEGVFLEHFRSFARLTQLKDEAVANLRAHRKLMKDQGVEMRAFDRAFKAKKLDDDTRAVAYRNEDLYLRYLRCPTGTQFGFFQEEMPIDASKAEDDGYFAGKEAKSSTDNPHILNSPQGQAWQKGWLRAQEEIAKSMKPEGEEAATAH